MPDGRTKKLRKSMCSEEQVAAPDRASASAPRKRKKKKKKQQQKMKSQMTPEEEAAAAANASTSPRKGKCTEKRKKSKKEKERKKVKQQGIADEEKKHDEAEEEKPSSLYLVVRHAVMCPTYSLFEVRHTQKSAEHPVPFPYRIQSLNAQHDMSFVAVSSARRSWIVGAGGFACGGQGLTTVVYDCKTGTFAVGPCLTESKYSPVVVAIGEKVYALCRMPSMSMMPEFPPLFEVLDLSGASCVDGRLIDCAWRALPFTALFDDLREGWSRVDRAPAEVESYAVVARRYILLSIVKDPFSPRDAGTVAFDASAEEWLYLDHNNLPFVGQAVPYGHLFLGRSKSSKDSSKLTAYDISVSLLATKTNAMTLSVTEVPITVGMTNGTPLRPGQFYASLGNGVICTVGCWTEGWIGDEEIERDGIYFNFHTPCSSHEQGKIVLSGSPSKYFFRLHEPACRLMAPSLVAAPCLTVI